MVYHFGDEEHQVIFWGPYAHDFIPIKQGYGGYDDYEVYGLDGQVLYSGKPSEIANWASTNLGQYRKQILYSKNGIVPKPRKHFYTDNGEFKSYVARDIPKSYNITYEVFNRSNIKQYLDSIKSFSLNEEVVADGNSEHNPYAKRWRKERQLLKDFLCNYGKVMTSKESGKDLERAGYQALKNAMLRRGDTLVVKSLDRLILTFSESPFTLLHISTMASVLSAQSCISAHLSMTALSG